MIMKSTIVRVRRPGAAILATPPLPIARAGSGKREATARERQEAVRLRLEMQGGQPPMREPQR
jgi:hypothetical protein